MPGKFLDQELPSENSTHMDDILHIYYYLLLKLSMHNYKILKKEKCFKKDVKMSHVKINEKKFTRKKHG